MAREEADRENLLEDATAYVARVQWQLAPQAGPASIVFAGFRADGAASFYFDADPVYHFNAAGELRRAFHGNRLLKAERGKLVRLERQRTECAVTLVRTELSPLETQDFCRQASNELARLQIALASTQFDLQGEVPAAGSVTERVVEWLGRHTAITIAHSPRAGG